MYNEEDLLDEAIAESITWEKQVEIDHARRVRARGDPSVVAATLRIRRRKDGEGFEPKLWYSDTCARRRKNGWKYAAGSPSFSLPSEK